MLVMRKVNRLIKDFKKQTSTSIWKHLDAMAANYAIYSTHLNGLPPFLTDYDVYLYCNDNNVVVVCLDACGNCEEKIYEEAETLSPLILTEGCEPRISSVYKLAEAVRHAREQLQKEYPDITVYGVLLTEAKIINSFYLWKMWDKHHITVLDGHKRLKRRKIAVNEDHELEGRAYILNLIEAANDSMTTEDKHDNKELPEDDDDDEYKELNDYIENLWDKLSSKEEDEEEDEKEDNADGQRVQSDDEGNDDIQIPDGVIEQNSNTSIRVEILRPIANPRKELEKLVGCDDIKRRMDDLIALTRYNKMMHEVFPESKQHEVSLHSVFLGRPGTGKTTVCKIYGSLLHEAGALSKGHVVVCDRGTFIGTLWGDEERSVRQVLEMARGGVLMIDEAYLLNGRHDSDPGKLVIPLLMNILADETQRDLAVVLCGYKGPMQKLLDTNPGLYSRFPNKFEFRDFTVDELMEITKRRLGDYDYSFTQQAWEKYGEMLVQAYKLRDTETWGNARFISNQLERIYIQHATRCIKENPQDKNELLMIVPEDIVPIEIPRPKVKIGF